MKEQVETNAQKSIHNGSDYSTKLLIERWSEMVTGRDIEILRERREQLLIEAADYRRIAALEDSPGDRTHVLAALGVSLVRAGYALQARFSNVTEGQAVQLRSLEELLVPGTSEGC